MSSSRRVHISLFCRFSYASVGRQVKVGGVRPHLATGFSVRRRYVTLQLFGPVDSLPLAERPGSVGMDGPMFARARDAPAITVIGNHVACEIISMISEYCRDSGRIFVGGCGFQGAVSLSPGAAEVGGQSCIRRRHC